MPGGAEAFGARTDYATNAAPGRIAVADFDGDGRLDVAVLTGSGFAVFAGLGDGSLGTREDYDATAPVEIAAADMNGDGLVDIAVSAYTARLVSVYLNLGNDAPLFATSTLADGKVALPYRETLAAVGGEPPYAWAVSSGELPGGLDLDAATGEISGVPDEEGRFEFEVAVSDASQPPQSAIRAFSVSIWPPDLIAPLVDEASVVIAPTPAREGLDGELSLCAVADDAGRGGTFIAAAEYFVDVDPGVGSGMPLAAADGGFDSPVEALACAIDVSGWTAPATRAIGVRARDAAGNWSAAATTTVKVVVAPGRVVDLAAEGIAFLEGVAAAVADDGGSTPGMPAANLVDGDAATFWRSAGTAESGGEYVTLDLGGVTSVSAVMLTSAGGGALFPRSFAIDVSPDGAAWRRAATLDTRATRGARLVELEPAAARYVRVSGQARRSARDGRYYCEMAEVRCFTGRGAPAALLTWTAPADDAYNAASGPVMEYDARYSRGEIDEDAFASLARADGVAVPDAPGTSETAIVAVDARQGDVSFALKSVDADDAWSEMSNVAAATVSVAALAAGEPADEYDASVGPPAFTFAIGEDVVRTYVAFSTVETLPGARALADDGLYDRTIRFVLPARVASAGAWRPSPAQWSRIRALALRDGKVYWRFEARSSAYGAVYAPVRALAVE